MAGTMTEADLKLALGRAEQKAAALRKRLKYLKLHPSKKTNKDNPCLESMLGERVTMFCGVYIYTGKLVSFNDTWARLEDVAIVYETGAYDNPKWKDAQNLPNWALANLRSCELVTILK